MRIRLVLDSILCVFVIVNGVQGQSKGVVREGEKTRCEYFIGGKQVTEDDYKRNNQTGLVKTFKNGILRDEDEYKDGRRHGKQISYYPSGKIERIQEYENGEYYGCLVEWHENGLISTLAYEDALNHRTLLWDKEGNLFQEFQKIKGKSKSVNWYKSGHKSGEVEETKDGDIGRSWHENAMLASQSETVDGHEILKIRYYENGQKESEEYPLEGGDRIRQTRYYQNGQIKSLSEYKQDNNERDGLWMRWEEDGRIKSVEIWKEGRRVNLKNLNIEPRAAYFPKEAFYDDYRKRFATFRKEWYSRQLDALKEPVLFHSQSTKEIYRFTLLRTFHEPIAVRIEKEEGQIYLYSKMADGAGGYDPGELAVDKKKMISAEQWNRLMSLIEKADFWKMEDREKDVKIENGVEFVTVTADGAQWILEGVKSGRYHVVDRNSPPETSEYRTCCEYVLELSDLKIVPIY